MSPKPRKLLPLWLTLSLLAVGSIVFLAMRDRTPLLERAGLEAARGRWERSGVADYDLRLSVEGDRIPAERYSLEVRGGKPVRFEKDGRPVEGSSPGGFNPGGYYTIDGLLQVIDEELAIAERGEAPGGGRWTLKAAFDPLLGYPRLYQRLAPGGQSRFIRVLELAPRGR